MASTLSHLSTPDPSQRINTNRSVTLPTALIASSSRPRKADAAIGEAEGIETLFVVAHATVVKFTTSASTARPSTLSGQESSGSLPWASPTERTMAAGPLEVYRVPGSVSFLHSGSLLHAILPRSQCWCVDGVSKFALRVLPDTYYRIDLPGESDEDLRQVEMLKSTLAQVLHYERTPCPFARTFTVTLPTESPKAGTKRRKHSGPAKRWRLHQGYNWKPEGEDGNSMPPSSEDSSASTGASDAEDDENSTAFDNANDSNRSTSTTRALPARQIRRDIKNFEQLGVYSASQPDPESASRSFTAPSHLTLQSTPPSKLRVPLPFPGSGILPKAHEQEVVEPSPLRSAQQEHFHPSIPVTVPPSPPDSSAGLDAETFSRPTEQVSLLPTTTQEIDRACDLTNGTEALHGDSIPLPDSPCPSELISKNVAASSSVGEDKAHQISTDCNQAQKSLADDPYAQIQARILARRSIGGSTTAFQPRARDSTSSASSTTTLASDRSGLSQHSNSMNANRQAFASALVNRACAVFLGPPAFLVEIMLRIARKIARGAIKVAPTFVIRQQQHTMPGSFDVDTTSSVSIADGEESDMDEDDFGVPLVSPIRRANTLSHDNGMRERRVVQ